MSFQNSLTFSDVSVEFRLSFKWSKFPEACWIPSITIDSFIVIFGGIATSTFDSSTPVWNFHTGVEESKVEFHGVEIAILG